MTAARMQSLTWYVTLGRASAFGRARGTAYHRASCADYRACDRELLTMKTIDWLKAACEDAERRGLAGLRPLLETLARSTDALRDADRADAPGGDESAGIPT